MLNEIYFSGVKVNQNNFFPIGEHTALGAFAILFIAFCLGLASCTTRAGGPVDSPVRAATGPERKPGDRAVRVAGMIQALKSVSIRVPQISAQSGRVTLSALIPNGSTVAKGDTLAEFDPTGVLDEERDVKAKLSEATYQLEERQAKVRRGESQVVVDGLTEGDVLTMANPIENQESAKSGGGLSKALTK